MQTDLGSSESSGSRSPTSDCGHGRSFEVSPRCTQPWQRCHVGASRCFLHCKMGVLVLSTTHVCIWASLKRNLTVSAAWFPLEVTNTAESQPLFERTRQRYGETVKNRSHRCKTIKEIQRVLKWFYLHFLFLRLLWHAESCLWFFESRVSDIAHLPIAVGLLFSHIYPIRNPPGFCFRASSHSKTGVHGARKQVTQCPWRSRGPGEDGARRSRTFSNTQAPFSTAT